MKLDREGIFRAVPITWAVKKAEQSESVAIAMEFQILEYLLEDGNWEDWRQYEVCTVRGDFWIVKKDGAINEDNVQRLAESLGWSGSLRHIVGNPPDCEVQITVKPDTYKGRTRFRAEWINPGDWSPPPQGADDATVAQLAGQYDSLLRASIAAGKAQAKKAQAAPPAPTASPATPARAPGVGRTATPAGKPVLPMRDPARNVPGAKTGPVQGSLADDPAVAGHEWREPLEHEPF